MRGSAKNEIEDDLRGELINSTLTNVLSNRRTSAAELCKILLKATWQRFTSEARFGEASQCHVTNNFHDAVRRCNFCYLNCELNHVHFGLCSLHSWRFVFIPFSETSSTEFQQANNEKSHESCLWRTIFVYTHTRVSIWHKKRWLFERLTIIVLLWFHHLENLNVKWS